MLGIADEHETLWMIARNPSNARRFIFGTPIAAYILVGRCARDWRRAGFSSRRSILSSLEYWE
jgi:hypothetical protein